MPGRPILLITASSVLLTVAGVILYSGDTEPSYKGRTLSQWNKASYQDSGEREAHEAIVSITTKSFPLLLRWAFADTNPRFDTMPRVSNLIYKLPFSITQNPHLRPLLYRENQIFRAACALRAFEIAGTNAACAVPALAAMMTNDNPHVTLWAIHVCSLIGPPAVPAIRLAMSSQLPYLRCEAIGCLKRFGTNTTEAIPDVVKALSDSDLSVRQNATNILETLYPQILTNSPFPISVH